MEQRINNFELKRLVGLKIIRVRLTVEFMKGREEDGEKCFEEPWEVEGKLSLQLNANK